MNVRTPGSKAMMPASPSVLTGWTLAHELQRLRHTKVVMAQSSVFHQTNGKEHLRRNFVVLVPRFDSRLPEEELAGGAVVVPLPGLDAERLALVLPTTELHLESSPARRQAGFHAVEEIIDGVTANVSRSFQHPRKALVLSVEIAVIQECLPDLLFHLLQRHSFMFTMELHGLVVGPSSSAEPLGQRLLLFRARIKADLLHSPHYRCLLCSGTSMELQQRIRQLTASIEQKKRASPALRLSWGRDSGTTCYRMPQSDCVRKPSIPPVYSCGELAEYAIAHRLLRLHFTTLAELIANWCSVIQLPRNQVFEKATIQALSAGHVDDYGIDSAEILRVLLGKSGLRLPDILFTAVTDSIVLCSVQVKTRIKRLAASKFIDAIRSTSRDWFLRGKSQDVKQHTKLKSLWENQLQQLPRGKSVCHLRFVMSWAGFTQAQVDLINSFNAKNPEQLILLVQPALTAVGDFIYGTRCNKFLSSTLGKHTKTRASKSKKNTLATEDLVMALLPQEMAWMGSPMAEEEEDSEEEDSEEEDSEEEDSEEEDSEEEDSEEEDSEEEDSEEEDSEEEDSEEEENRGKDRAPAAKRPKRED